MKILNRLTTQRRELISPTQRIWASLHPFYEGGAVLGRKEANRGFIEALLEADPYDAYHFYLSSKGEYEYLKGQLECDFPVLWKNGRLVLRAQRELPRALQTERFHCFHLSDCISDFNNLARARNALSQVIFPITGPTHSLSYLRFHNSFMELLGPQISGRDSIVTTSRAGTAVVANMFRLLRENYRLPESGFPSPRLDMIPLGVDARRVLAEPDSPEWNTLRADMRYKLGADADSVIFLAFSRLSSHSKMDFIPLLQAFRRAEKLKNHPYLLVLAGWVEDGDPLPGMLETLAKNTGVRLKLLLHPTHDERKALYAAADVFLSPSDNLQETFGLTMLEAAAARLPVIASDFDGYRDLVQHERSGFLIPSYGPFYAPATDALAGLIYDSDYHLALAQQCVVDVPALARGIEFMAGQPVVRREMGETGRANVLANYTWEIAIRRHVALWDNLNAVTLSEAEEDALRRSRSPIHPPFMEIFASHFTRRLDCAREEGFKLRWSKNGEALYRGKEFPVIYGELENKIDMDFLKQLVFFARNGVTPQKLHAEMRTFAAQNASFYGKDKSIDPDFLMLWAVKQDFLEII